MSGWEFQDRTTRLADNRLQPIVWGSKVKSRHIFVFRLIGHKVPAWIFSWANRHIIDDVISSKPMTFTLTVFISGTSLRWIELGTQVLVFHSIKGKNIFSQKLETFQSTIMAHLRFKESATSQRLEIIYKQFTLSLLVSGSCFQILHLLWCENVNKNVNENIRLLWSSGLK